tara:strand:- start:2624 stop:2980 length:357 start_codon:yes stop_codon:yes gene_type:complete
VASEDKLEQFREDALRDEYEEERQGYCLHENAYIQEFRAIVSIKQDNLNRDNPEILETDWGTYHRYSSDMFDLEAEHYCPDCGKSKWVPFDLDEEMYYKSANRWTSVTGESDEVLRDW